MKVPGIMAGRSWSCPRGATPGSGSSWSHTQPKVQSEDGSARQEHCDRPPTAATAMVRHLRRASSSGGSSRPRCGLIVRSAAKAPARPAAARSARSRRATGLDQEPVVSRPDVDQRGRRRPPRTGSGSSECRGRKGALLEEGSQSARDPQGQSGEIRQQAEGRREEQGGRRIGIVVRPIGPTRSR